MLVGEHDARDKPDISLINEYSRPTDSQILYHLDCYRLMSDDDVETIGLEDILASDGALSLNGPRLRLIGFLMII